MPKSRSKGVPSKNVAASIAPKPLLDCLRAQAQPSLLQNNDTESDIDSFKVSTSGWQCDIDDWSSKKRSENDEDRYPKTLRSIERKHEQGKNKFLHFPQTITNENHSAIVEPIDNQTHKLSFNNINVSKLSSIVTDLITGKRDESAYADFLSILQHFSVRSSRDDHLEETVYHLIQAAVCFIRSNEARFDPSKLQECYRQRSILKTDSAN